MDGQLDDDFAALLEKSSLGGPAARQMRERTSVDHARTVRRIIELRNRIAHHGATRDETDQAARQLLRLLESLGYLTRDEIPPALHTASLLAQDGGTLAAKVRTLAPSMTRSMQRVAEAVTNDPAGCAALTITALAERTGTSEATVVRTARLLGYPGYRDLRLALAGLAAQQHSRQDAARTDASGGRPSPSPLSGRYGLIVVPRSVSGAEQHTQLRLSPGERLVFGSAPDNELSIAHDGVSHRAGEITAQGSFWLLSNLSPRQTYVVENPEGASEFIKVGPGRLDAPVPFEFSRIVLPADGDLLSIEVWAPRHDYLSTETALTGGSTAPALSLDRTKRYFAVLAALCEPRLRGEPHAPLPTVDQVVARLRPNWPAASRTSIQWNIDYLAVKLRLKPRPEVAGQGPRLNGKKESLVSLALRFDLVREDDLIVLDTVATQVAEPGARPF